MNWGTIFLTGLTTGGLSCLAVQGGLLTSVIANQKEAELQDAKTKTGKDKKRAQMDSAPRSFDILDWMPVTAFMVSKLVSHTLLGFALGFVGSKLELSLSVSLGFQLLAALFMLATAMNLLDAHPVFRYVMIQPPKFLTRRIRSLGNSRAIFAPAILGFLTIFIPCGVTQAMEVLAVTSGSPITGALIMFTFVLGTTPIFGLLGLGTAKLSEVWQGTFMKIAASALIFLGLSSINGILVVLDSPLTFEKVKMNLLDPAGVIYDQGGEAKIKDGLQQIEISVTNSGYSPTRVQAKVGIPVRLTLTSSGVYSCASFFVFPEFGIKTQLKPTDTQTFEFTPTKKGRFTYACSMGMYTGIMEVR